MTRDKIFSVSLVAVAAAWGFAVAYTCWFAGDRMIGFSSFILFGLPFAAFVLAIGLILAGVCKSIPLSMCAVLAFSLVLAPLLSMHQITRTAWNASLRENSSSNQIALQHTDFSGAEFVDAGFPDDRRMVTVDGFTWYCEQHQAAPNAIFRGFRYNSIPHVYVNKIRNGLRGVAWIEDRAMIPSPSEYEYRRTGVDNWYVWTYGES